jgi:hypothetical protein
MGGRDDLCTLMRRLLRGLTRDEEEELRAEEASECGDPIAESCGQPAGGGEAVRNPAAHPGR